MSVASPTSSTSDPSTPPRDPSARNLNEKLSIFGKKVKFRKIRKNRSPEKGHSTDSDGDLSSVKLKHVDDSKKNLWSRNQSRDELITVKLRSSPNKTRSASPMPPRSEFSMPHLRAVGLPSDDNQHDPHSDANSVSPLHPVQSFSPTSAVSVSTDFDRERRRLIHTQPPFNRSLSDKTRDEIDLNAVRAKLRNVGIHQNENQNDNENDTECDITEYPTMNIPRSQSVEIGSSRNEIQKCYQFEKAPDTELDDVSSSRSNSLQSLNHGKGDRSSLNGNNTKLSTIRSGSPSLRESKESKDSKPIQITEPEPETDDEVQIESESNEIITKQQSEQTLGVPTYNVFRASTVPMEATSRMSSRSSSRSSSPSSSSSESDSDSDMMFPKSAPKMKTKISLETSDKILSPKNDPNLIGKMTTPTFRKRMELEAKKRLQPRAKTGTAKGAKSWCFGLGSDGIPEIGAIKTPKFGPKAKDNKSRRDLALQRSRSRHETQNAMDLFHVEGLDELNLDDDDFNNEFSDGVYSSRSYHSDYDSDRSHSDSRTRTRSRTRSSDDGSLRSDNFSANSSEYQTDDDYPETPKAEHLTPLHHDPNPHPVVNSNEEIHDIDRDREVTPSIEPDMDADDIPALPSNDEDTDFMDNIMDNIMDPVLDQKPFTIKKETSASMLSLPPFLQHSDTEDEPLPDPSPYEKEVEEERVKKEKIVEIIKEIEFDEEFEDNEAMRRLQSERRRDMATALDGMFDDLSVSMNDSHLMSPRMPLPPSPRPYDSDLVPLKEDGFPIHNEESPTPPPPELGLLGVPQQEEDDMKMSSDLGALLEELSVSEEEEEEEENHWNAPGRRVSLEDNMENEQMIQEDNEPLGDLEDAEDYKLNENDDNHNQHNHGGGDHEGTEEEEEEEEDEEEPEIQNTMTLSQIMHDFKLDPSKSGRLERLHEYFSESLDITFAHEMLEHVPSAITQPPGDEFKSTKLRMRLVKMAKFVTAQITMSQWTGSKKQSWLDLDESHVTSYTFAKPQRVQTTAPSIISPTVSRSPKVPTVHFENTDGGPSSNRTKIKGQRMTCIDKDISVGQTMAFTFDIDSLPEIDRVKGQKRARLITAGIRFFDEEDLLVETLAITDRCNIERNGRYIGRLPQRSSRFIENGSQIAVELDNKREEPVVRFKHYRHGKLVNKKKSTFRMEGLVQNEKCYAKMYIEQYYGRGNYAIRETRKSRRDLRVRRRSSKKLKFQKSAMQLTNEAMKSMVSPTQKTIGGRKRYRASI